MMIDGRKPIAVKNIAARTAKAMALKPEPAGPGNQRENLSKPQRNQNSRRAYRLGQRSRARGKTPAEESKQSNEKPPQTSAYSKPLSKRQVKLIDGLSPL